MCILRNFSYTGASDTGDIKGYLNGWIKCSQETLAVKDKDKKRKSGALLLYMPGVELLGGFLEVT